MSGSWFVMLLVCALNVSQAMAEILQENPAKDASGVVQSLLSNTTSHCKAVSGFIDKLDELMIRPRPQLTDHEITTVLVDAKQPLDMLTNVHADLASMYKTKKD